MANNAPRVAVGCKHPQGLILHFEKEGVDGDTGGKRFFRDDDREVIVLKGNNTTVDAPLVNAEGFGITMVDKALWDEWAASHQKSPLLKSGMIFVEETKARAQDRADEQKADVKTGLEGIDPNKPGSGIKKDDEVMK